MSRADIYEYILYYTKLAEEDASKIKDSPSPGLREFYSQRTALSSTKIQIHIEQLKAIDRKEREENE
tara:strand:- start:310 stop:510 length:201 start_codon:yes stop_codon:yes gene_type:complete